MNFIERLIPSSSMFYWYLLFVNNFHAWQGWDLFWGPFSYHSLTVNPEWISNHMPSNVWDKIVYPFPNFNGCTVEVWQWLVIFSHTLQCVYLLSMQHLTLNHVSKWGPRFVTTMAIFDVSLRHCCSTLRKLTVIWNYGIQIYLYYE